MDIHKYRNNVNANVFKAIEQGVFVKAKTLDDIPNLMDHEDRFTYYIHSSLWQDENKAKQV